MSIAAYRRAVADTESPRDFERRILTRITNELAAQQESFDAAPSKLERGQILSGPLRMALGHNLKFWSALRLDLISPDNQYPASLRAELISLSMFVERQVNAILGGRGTVAALVDINRSILAGMSRDAATPAPAKQAV